MTIFEQVGTSEDVASKSNGLRKALIAAALITAFGIVAWRFWTRTPQYALREVAAAYREHDLSKFQEYVDSEHLSGSFVDQMMQAVFDDKSDDQGPSWGKGLVQGMAMMMRPQLVKSVSDAITKGVESGNFGEDSKGGAKLSEFKSYFNGADGDQSGFRGVKSIKKEGKIAIASLEIYDKDFGKSAFIDVKLRDVGDHWQVTELSNLADFMKTLQNYERDYVANLNKPIIEKMNDALKFERGSASTSSDSWGIRKSVEITTTFTNRGPRRIDEYDALLSITGEGGKATKLKIMSNHGVSPGATDRGLWSKDVNMFMAADDELYKAVENGASVSAELRRIKFDDGEELKLATSRSDVPSATHAPRSSESTPSETRKPDRETVPSEVKTLPVRIKTPKATPSEHKDEAATFKPSDINLSDARVGDNAPDTSGEIGTVVGGQVTPPAVISRVEPEYPEVARRARIAGIVIIECLVNKDGNLSDAKVLKPLPFGLDQAALDAVRKYEFAPATRNGEPVEGTLDVTVNFKLK